jgi:hypothetical protein
MRPLIRSGLATPLPTTRLSKSPGLRTATNNSGRVPTLTLLRPCTFHIEICPAASWLRFALVSRSCSLYRRFDIGQGNLHTLSHAAVLARLRFRPDNMGHHAQGIPNNARCTQPV